MKTSEVYTESLKIRDILKSKNDFKENPIDSTLNPVLPYRISNRIKLIILGQDPTVKNAASRQTIEYTLNLDKEGSLKCYVSGICSKLGMGFENIYATNIFKYFYTDPPERTMEVLKSHLDTNLRLLKEELLQYKNIPIIALGLPVLQLLVGPKAQVRDFWAYVKATGKTTSKFTLCDRKENLLERDFYSFPHQPSIRKKFYSDTMNNYIKFVKKSTGI